MSEGVLEGLSEGMLEGVSEGVLEGVSEAELASDDDKYVEKDRMKTELMNYFPYLTTSYENASVCHTLIR